MKLLIASVLLALGAGLVGAEGPLHSLVDLPSAKPHFRLIHGLVLGLDGKPAVHRKVTLVGLSRGALHPYSDAPDGYVAGWNFTTDRNGRFTAAIGDFGTWEDPKSRPGWGTFALVAEAGGDDAGAVSTRFFHYSEDQGGQSTIQTQDGWGDILYLPPDGLDLTLQIKPGITLRGMVRDGTKPLAGVTVSTFNDMGADTHTGHGGEVLGRKAVTDAQGRFMIRHIYPAAFSVQLKGATWLKTKVDGAWVDGPGDVVSAPAAVTHLEIMASARPSFRYFGRVVDGEGKPLAGAQVTFGMSYHPQNRTFEDDHTYCFARTQADGAYEINLDTPWVRGMDAEAVGFQRQDAWTTNDVPTDAPGEYDFTLDKK